MIDIENLEQTLTAIPRDRELVVYCACPNEASAAKVAVQLHKRGVSRIRPLASGIDAWAAAGLRLERADPHGGTAPRGGTEDGRTA